MIRAAALAGWFAAVAFAQHRFDNELVVTFGGAGALRVHTESTLANSRLAGNGVVAMDKGAVSHRKVLDPHGKVLFEYDLRLSDYRLGAPVPKLVFTDRATGEQLFDVIERVVAVEKPPVSPEHEISLEAMRISVNGKLVHESRNSWIINESISIDVPGRFRIVAVQRTGQSPAAMGRVHGRKLTFTVGKDQVEIESRSNVFKTRESGPVWIYRD